jgi:hypothetical protein
MMQTLISPIYITINRQRSASKRITLGLNWFRNAHYHTVNAAKVEYLRLMRSQIQEIPCVAWPIKLRCRYYLRRRCDVGNIHSVIEKFFLDCLVTLGRLPDDDVHHVLGASYCFAGFDTKNPRAEIEIMENY